MKDIKLSITKELHEGRELELNTKELIRLSVKNVLNGGFTVDEMISRMRILDAVDKANDSVLQLEDSDFANLSTYVKGMRWNIISKAIVEFSNQFS